MHNAKVILVGAGPGDPGLLTLRGKQALEQADVVVCDRLVNNDILQFAPQAKMIYVGKEQGNHSVPQHRINEILVEEARAGSVVVRLKGGDPYVFGRGSEEVEKLIEHGIAFEVVPGVTSALAVPSYAGIPATHRGLARSVHVFTGRTKLGVPPDIDYEALVRMEGTFIFLMALSAMEVIVQGLQAAGMAPSTPAAVVGDGTLPTQRSVQAPLSTIVEKARANTIESPAILVVGEVCSFADELNWAKRRPLFGTSVVVTRPKARAGTLVERLRALGAQVEALACIEAKGIESQEFKQAFSCPQRYSWSVFTSPQGVQHTFEQLAKLNLDARVFGGQSIAAVGAGTQKALAEKGLLANFVPAHFDGAHLAEGLVEHIKPHERVLLLRAEQSAPDLTRVLTENGCVFEEVAVYRTELVGDAPAELRQRFERKEVSYVTFTSASTVEGFAACLPDVDPSSFVAVCIGDLSQACAKSKGYRTLKAENATIDCLIKVIEEQEAPL